MLADLKVSAIITVPADFDSLYQKGVADPVDITINNLNVNFTNDLRRALPTAITHFYASSSGDPFRVSVREHDLRTQDVDLAQFEMVPNVVLLITISGVVSTALATAREFEEQTFKEMILSPARRGALVIGKLLGSWVTTLIVAAVMPT